MTTLIINTVSGDRLTLATPLYDPERMDSEDLIETERELYRSLEDNEIPANVYVSEENYVLSLFAPGLIKENILVDVNDNDILSISAEADEEDEDDLENYCRKEFAQTGFSRLFQLPEDVLSEEILAEYKDGVITLVIPRTMN